MLVRHLRDVVFKEQLSEIDLMCERMNPEDVGDLAFSFPAPDWEGWCMNSPKQDLKPKGTSFPITCCSVLLFSKLLLRKATV